MIVPALLILLLVLYAAGSPPTWILWWYLAASVITFVAYAHDKAAAQRRDWRVSERTLHLLASLGGWPGALLAQQTLRHKSVKQAFRRIFWGTVAVNIAALALLSFSGKA